MNLRIILTVAALLAGTGAATANCYEGLGCDDSQYFTTQALQQGTCQQLWEVRNMIYQQNGYCFQTNRAKQSFSNDGCYINDQASVRLNVYERKNVATIQSVEKAKGCK
ncbi:YARHG domain-containing protein [Devosia sp. 2618]|uniref:YARHG domain-containing protein n=1 Tax=Devosia sp. 2618 TaxID=3156454 RepID=UPI0033909F10